MTLRYLPVDDHSRAQLRALRDYASNPANWWTPGEVPVPGDIPANVVVVGSFRVVFSWTRLPDADHPHRHMSVSIEGGTPGKFPNPAAVFTIAHLLGFTGARADKDGVVPPDGGNPEWSIHLDERDSCVVMGQCVAVTDVPPPATPVA